MVNAIIFELTGGISNGWPDGQSFPSLELSLKYSALHWIALKNWYPTRYIANVYKNMAYFLFCIGTRRKVLLGQHIFGRIVRHAELVSTTLTLPP